MIHIAIDPGATGGIAWLRQLPDDSITVDACKMPSTNRDIWNTLETLTGENCRCTIEKVGTYMPGNSGPSAAKFAEHVGALKMALIGHLIPHDFVTPQQWQAVVIGKPSYPKIDHLIQGLDRKRILDTRKRERKNKIKARMQEVYPHLNVTLVNADALGILYYATNTGEAGT